MSSVTGFVVAGGEYDVYYIDVGISVSCSYGQVIKSMFARNAAHASDTYGYDLEVIGVDFVFT